MGENEQVIVVAEDGEHEAGVEEIVHGVGYSICYANSFEDVGALDGEDAQAPRAVVIRGSGLSSGTEQIQRFAQGSPRSKFVCVIRQGNGTLAKALEEALGQSRALCVDAGDDSLGRTRAIRSFLQGDGYFWARDLEQGDQQDRLSLLTIANMRRIEKSTARKLLSFATSFAGLRTLDELLQIAVRQFSELLESDAVSLYLWDEASGRLVLKVAEGPDKEKRQGWTQALGEGLAGWVAEAKEPILVSDVKKVPKLKNRRSTRYADSSCMLCPIQQGGNLFGVASFTMHKDSQPFLPKDLRLAQYLCEKLGAILLQFRLAGEVGSINDRVAEWCQPTGHFVLEKEAEVDALRLLSAEILEFTPLSVIVYDLDLGIRLANTSAQKLLGGDVEEAPAAGAPLEGQLDFPAEEWAKKLRDVVEREVPFRLHRLPCRTAGGTALLDVSCSPLRGSDQRVIGGILLLQDVSDVAKMEEKLSVAERLALMGKITAEVAHELNNPLDGILRFQSLATRFLRGNPDEANACLEEIRKGLLRMSNILGEMLALSRGPRSEADRPASVSELLSGAIKQYEGRARDMGIEIQAEIPSGLPMCPKPGLCGVFGNVIKNALDAMGGAGELRIVASEEGEWIRVRISDSGPGVPEGLAEKVFEPFFTTREVVGGTGLGLAWCREFMSNLGGAIRLCPSEQGAVFEIDVPARGKEY